MEIPQPSRQEKYQKFIAFVQTEVRREQSKANLRFFSVVFWCLLLPFGLTILSLALLKAGIIPSRLRVYQDWVFLFFPISYSLYFVGFEVLRDIPQLLKLGGLGMSLAQSLKESAWRDRTVEGMKKAVDSNREDWSWIIENFDIDIRSMRNRTSYVTALAGAVFFLIIQGFDFFDTVQIYHPKLDIYMLGNWFDAVRTQFLQLVGLGLFLMLLYLAGSQLQQTLERYLNCARLLRNSIDPGKNS